MIQNIFKWRRYRVKHRAMEAAKICLSFLLVPLLLLSLGLASLPAHGEVEFGNWEDMVDTPSTEVSLSKTHVFKGEVFQARAVASATLKQDIDFNNAIDLEYDVFGKLGTGGEIILGSYNGSLGPFPNLKSGTRLSYTLLDAPVAFPAAASPGDYTLYMEITKIEPEDIWNTVKENVDVEELTIELGSIKYLGIETPEIRLALTSQDLVDAGATFPVNLDVTSPEGVDQVNLSLSYQKAGEVPIVVENWSTAGTASQTINITAPIYSGELKLRAAAGSFVVMGKEIVLAVPATASLRLFSILLKDSFPYLLRQYSLINSFSFTLKGSQNSLGNKSSTKMLIFIVSGLQKHPIQFFASGSLRTP